MLILLLTTLSIHGKAQSTYNDAHWQVVWDDQFNFLDLTRWLVSNNCDHAGEPQLYMANNVRL